MVPCFHGYGCCLFAEIFRRVVTRKVYTHCEILYSLVVDISNKNESRHSSESTQYSSAGDCRPPSITPSSLKSCKTRHSQDCHGVQSICKLCRHAARIFELWIVLCTLTDRVATYKPL